MSNFGQIRSELKEIKQEFLQEQASINAQSANLVQLNSQEGEEHLAVL